MKKEKFESIVKREAPYLAEILKVRRSGFISEERARECYGHEMGFTCNQDERGNIYVEFVRRPDTIVFRPLTEETLRKKPWGYYYSSGDFSRYEGMVAYVVDTEGEVTPLDSGYLQEWGCSDMKPSSEDASMIAAQLIPLRKKGRAVKYIVTVETDEATDSPSVMNVTIYRAKKEETQQCVILRRDNFYFSVWSVVGLGLLKDPAEIEDCILEKCRQMGYENPTPPYMVGHEEEAIYRVDDIPRRK
jgi:hypothetical protein